MSNNKKPASLFTIHPVEALLYGASMILAGACFAAMGGVPLAAGLAVGALTAVATTTRLPQLLKQKLSSPHQKKAAAQTPVATPTTSKFRWQKLRNIFKRSSAPQTPAVPQAPAPTVEPAVESAPAATSAPAAAA